MKKVLLDCGANIGQSYEWFMKNRDDSDEYEVHCFEPVPSFKHHFENKNLTFHSDAVWIEDGTIDFYDKGGLSSTLYKHKIDNAGQGTRTTSSCIDFSKFIKDNFKLSDYIIVKMDIEGAEYKVIEKMLEKGTFEYIDEFYIEFHGSKIKDLYPYYDEIKERTGLDAKHHLMQEIDKFDVKWDIYPYDNWGNF
jgi:FkbM family methyltransferase